MAWYIVNVRERFGSDAGIIFEALCKHGKLTRTALLATATKVKVTQEYTVEKIPEDLTDIRTKLSDCFEKLVRRRVIRRADTFQKRFTEKIRVPRNKRVGMQPVQHVQLSNKRRKTGMNSEPSPPFTAQMLIPLENIDHRMFEIIGDDEEGKREEEVVWQIYHQHFMCELRNHEISKFVKKRVDDEKACKLINCILREYAISGNVLRPPLTLAHMRNIASKSFNIPREVLKQLVNLMFSLNILESKSSSNQKFQGAINAAIMHDSWAYTVDIESILAELKTEHAQSMVISKFGGTAGRIFRLLVDRKRLEEKQVAEMAILPKKEVRTLLQSMMREGFTKLQEIPKDSARGRYTALFAAISFTFFNEFSHSLCIPLLLGVATPLLLLLSPCVLFSCHKKVRTLLQSMMREGFTKLQEIPKDSARRRMLHLWTVDFTHVCKILMDRYYQTWVNLSIRCAHEVKNVKPILSKINQGIALNRDEKDQVERWKAVDRKLRHGMAEVAGLIHLFREYE
eukprot:CAMPEP_0185281108 /NCGR_PEP_ID=MMETSP1359-20130426/66532_1 /TAXON_ID=552665 /ORGANISM="Bigelowiella longifila, Strain CCMP242" /LENGTH=511 /DNA_ID=CAMNT_0027876497 /DNA_START=243 /DNA_END=1778 /DNA_ORIENTATION=-